MELDKSMLYVETAEGKDIELLYQLCKKQSYEEFCLWGADFVYDYPPNLAQMKQSYALRKRMLLYRVIFQERIIGFAELDQIQENQSDAVLARVVLEPEMRGRGLGTFTIKSILKQAFCILQLERVSLVVYQNNTRAISGAMKHAGFGWKRHSFARAVQMPGLCGHCRQRKSRKA